MTVDDVLRDVRGERLVQVAEWGRQAHPDGTGPPYHNLANMARETCDLAFQEGKGTWRLVLREEFYEALAEDDPVRLRAELVQVAAVAVAWIEDIDSRE